MRKGKFNSRVLRQLAQELLQKLGIPEEDLEDYTTSLVRQWITYDGNATLFFEEHQIYFLLGQTPLGKPHIVPEPGLPGWMKQLTKVLQTYS